MESESFIGSSMKVKVEGSMKKKYLSAASTSSLAPNPTALAADIKPSVHRLGWKGKFLKRMKKNLPSWIILLIWLSADESAE